MYIPSERQLDFKNILIRPKPGSMNSRLEPNVVGFYKTKWSNKHFLGVPVIAANMFNTGSASMAKTLCQEYMFTCLHKFISYESVVDVLTSEPANYVFVSFGIQPEELNRLDDFYKHNQSIAICIDVANGYTPAFYRTIGLIREKYPKNIIMAGNVCTAEGAIKTFEAGADIVKVGIGNGGQCLTQSVTGVGMKQVSSVMECSKAIKGFGGLICSDGGIRESGDICKALAVGADLVMVGSLFMGYDENEGEWESGWDTEVECSDSEDSYYFGKVVHNPHKYLTVFGMSSSKAHEFYADSKTYIASEGKIDKIPSKGPITPLLKQIIGGLRSCMTYIDAHSIDEIFHNAEIVQT